MTPAVLPHPSAVTAVALALRVFYGHHKCATGWIDDVLREVAFRIGTELRIVHTPSHFASAGSLGALVEREQVDLLAYTNAELAQARTLPAHRGFHVVRDPRDLLVSAYFSHLHSHSTEDWPELAAHRAALQSLSKEEGLFAEMEFSAWVFRDMDAWDYEQPHVLELKMETLTAAPREGFQRVLEWLGLIAPGAEGVRGLAQRAALRMNRLHYRGRRYMPGGLPLFPAPRQRLGGIPRVELERVLEEKSFVRLAGGRARGTENVKSHYRKGTPGDWRNHFTEAHAAAFAQRYGGLLVRLGYETDEAWALHAEAETQVAP